MTTTARPAADLAEMTFEDFRVGQVFETTRRDVTAADLATFTEVSGDANAIHVVHDDSRAPGFGQPVLQGPFGLAAFFGLFYESGIARDTVVALLDTRWRYVAPIHVGDVLSATITITHCRRTSSGTTGVVGRHVVLRNQNGVVQHGSTAFLVRAREQDGARDHPGRAFFTRPWAAAIAERLTADPTFASATATWDGSIGLRQGEDTVLFRVYCGRVLEGASRTPHGATFCVESDELSWAQLLTGPTNDLTLRMMSSDAIKVSGNAYEYLRLSKALTALVDVIRAFAREEDQS